MSDQPPTPEPEPKYVTHDELRSMFDEFFEKLKGTGVDDDTDLSPLDDDDDGSVGMSAKEIEAKFEKMTQDIIAVLKPKRSPRTARQSDVAPPKPPPEPQPREAGNRTLQETLQRIIFGKSDETAKP